MSERGSRIRVLRPAGLAITALVLATGALVTDVANGAESALSQPASIGTATASPLDLARWIRDGRPGLQLLDARSPAAFEEYHIPTAANADPAALSTQADRARTLIVVYDDAGDPDGAAVEAARILSQTTGADTRILAGGLDAWTRDILRPTIAADAPRAERTRFEEVAALSRWFDGIPRVVAGSGPTEETDRGSTAGSSRRFRRGC